MPAEFSGVCMQEPVKREKSDKKPILQGADELEYNKRSKSAKLRVFERRHK